jgi:hypothetical protein
MTSKGTSQQGKAAPESWREMPRESDPSRLGS